jgi:hypothetical protein
VVTVKAAAPHLMLYRLCYTAMISARLLRVHRETTRAGIQVEGSIILVRVMSHYHPQRS